jgi:arsenate reductase
LKTEGIEHRYREYTKEPLTLAELQTLFEQLDVGPADVLRSRDPAYKELGLTGQEPDSVLIGHFAAHPTLLQRPIGVWNGRAVVGRPVERLLSLR